MDDLELMQQDAKRMEDAATMTLRLFDGNPEQVTVAVDKARETGLPLQWVMESDNAEMSAPLSASGFHPKFQKLIVQNPDRVPTYRDQLAELNALTHVAAKADTPPEAREAELQKQYAERGVPYPMRVSLAQRGFKELPSGAYLMDGKVVHAPVAREELCGAEELKQIDKWMGTLRKQVKLDFSELEGFENITPAGKKELLGRIMAHYEKRVAAMQSLSQYDHSGRKWNSYNDKDLRGDLLILGDRMGIDLSDIEPASLRRGGMDEVDYLEAVNVLGARDLYKFATALSPEELAAVDENSSYADQMKKLEYLAAQSLDLRGRTTAGQIATVVANMIPYMAEIATTGGMATVGKGAAKAGLGLAVKNTLREGGFTGLKAGAKALVSKEGVKAVGKAAGMVLAGEAKRLPAYTGKIGLQAYNEWRGGPVYYLGDGDVKTAIPEKTVDELATLIFRNALQTYMGNVSEWGGGFLPAGVSVSRFIPKKWRSAVVQRFISDISQDKAKYAMFRNALEGSVPLQGVVGEYLEEKLNNGMERASTVGYEITGLSALDMGRQSVFGDREEDTVIMVSSMIGSTGGKGLRLPSRISHYRKLARFVDTHRGMVDAVAKTKLIQRSPAQTKEFLDVVRGGDMALDITPEDANTLLQSDPEFAASVGITQDSVAAAQAKGLLLQLSQNQLLVEQAKNPANQAAGEKLLGMVRGNGMTVKEALAADMGSEAVSVFTEQRERIERLTTKIYTACEAASRSGGVSPQAARSYARVAAFMVNHLSQHSAVDGEVEAALDALTVKFTGDPESFVGSSLPIRVSATTETPVESVESVESETKPHRTRNEIREEARQDHLEAIAGLDPELLKRWLPEIGKLVEGALYKWSGVKFDETDLQEDLMYALAQAVKFGTPESETFENYVRVAFANAIKSFMGRRKKQQSTVSLDAEIGDDGATVEDFVADSRPDDRAQAEDAEFKAAQISAMKKILATLSPEDREFFEAVASEKKTLVEVAAERGTTKQNESQRYARILARVQLSAKAEMRTLYQAVGDRFSAIRRALPVESAETPLYAGKLNNVKAAVAEIAAAFQQMPQSVKAADGASVLLHNAEHGRLADRVLHLIKVRNKQTGDRDFFSSDKIKWFPRVPETLLNAQAKLEDPESGNFAYVRMYAEGLHVVFVTAEGVTTGHEVYTHGLLTQFAERFASPKRDAFPVVWEKSPPSPASARVLPGENSSGDASSSSSVTSNIAPSLKNVKLNQEGGSVVRGSTTFAADFNESFKAVVALFKAANASTLPHETAHWVKRMMEALVASGHADEQLTKELESINNWLDRQKYEAKPDTPEYLREREEKFARAFECYIQTGKPPVSGVEAAFSTLKHFLMAIYKYVRTLPETFGFEMDEEIKSVFESMLSTDELIAKESPLREATDALKETYQGLLGLSQAEANDFIRLVRNADAQMEGIIERRKKALLPALKKQWRKQAEAIMKDLKVYQVWNAAAGEGRLDYEFLKAALGKDTAKLLHDRGLTKKDGTDVALFAEKHGYSSVDALAAELLNTTPPKDFAAQYMAQQKAKFDSDLAMDEAAMSASATRNTLDKLIDLLAVKGGREGLAERKVEMIQNAKKEIAEMPVSQIISDKRHINSIRSLNKDLVKAIGKKDFLTALDLAQKIRRNLTVLKEKADAKERIDKTRKLLRRAGEAKKGSIYGIHHEALKELAYYFGFSKRQPEPHSGEQTFREQAATPGDAELPGIFGDAFDWPKFLLREEASGFQQLAYADFEELADFASFLYGEGRERVKEAKGTFAARVHDRVAACVETLEKQQEKYNDRQDKSLWEKTRSYTRSFLHWGENLNTFLGRADQFAHVGENAVRGPNMQLRDLLVEAEAKQIALAAAAMDSCATAIKALDESTKDMKMPQVKFTGDGLLYGYDKWTRETVIAACLNMGNPENRQRLMDGYGWKDADLAEIASCLTKADWANVQQIWDAINGELQEAVSKTFLEENHYLMKLVPAAEFSVASADGGDSITVKGGYYPIKYAHRTKGKDVAMGYSPRKLHADVSSTHRRAEHPTYPDPVKLSLLVPLHHIQEAARYAATRMACREVLDVVRDSRYKTAFGTTQSFEVYKDVLAILKNIANPAETEGGIADAFERWGRTALTATALMGNLKTVAMQSASLTIGANELGSYYMESVAAFGREGLPLLDEIRSKSAMMAHRAEYFDMDLRTRVNRMADSPVEKTRKGFAQAGYFCMRFMDAGVASVGWYGKYLQTVNQLTAEGLDPDLIESKAIAQADDFVARTQGAARTLDLTPAQLTSIGRLLSPFITASGAQYNTMLETLGAARGGRLSGAEMFGAFLFNLLIPAVMSGTIAAFAAGMFGDDDDKDRANKRFFQELISSPFGGIPLGRDAADALAGVAVSGVIGGKKLYRGDILDAGTVGAVNDILTSAYSGTGAALDGNWARAAWLWADAIGSATHTPAIRIYTKAKKMYENNGGELPEFLQALDDAVKTQSKKGTHK